MSNMIEDVASTGAEMTPTISDMEKERGKGGTVEARAAAPFESDAEEAILGTVHEPGIHRGLKSRHIQLIALGGSIGTGLFIASGSVLHSSGPIPLILGYLIMSMVVWSSMNVLGEMTSYLPLKGATVPYMINRYLDPSFAFAAGWNYWFAMMIVVPIEVVACARLMTYWTTSVPAAAWITIFLAVNIGLNLLAVEWYGESEFWFASLKFLAILVLLITSTVIFFGGAPNSHGVLGFEYWNNPGAVKEYLVPGSTGRFLAVWYAVCKAGFAFVFAPELLITTAGEVRAPRRNIPKVTRRYIYRLIFIYFLSTIAIGVTCPYNDPELVAAIEEGVKSGAASPFVAAIKRAGIKGLDHVINAAILTSAASAGNSWLYSGSRTLYTLALEGHAPEIFAKTSVNGNPYPAVIATSVFSTLAYLTCSTTSTEAFTWFSSLSTISGLVAWMIVFVTYLRFRKACQYRQIQDTLPFKAPLQPYLSYFGFIMCALITLTNGFSVFIRGHWNTSTFLTDYLSIAIVVVFYAAFKIYKRGPIWRPIEEIDVITGKEEMDRLEEEDHPAVLTTWYRRFWAWLC